MRQITAHVQTREQLDEILNQVDVLVSRQDDGLKDPPVINRKGRPLTQRFTSAIEGRARGGGANARHPPSQVATHEKEPLTKKQVTRCGVCRKEGHNRTTCPILHRSG